MYTENSEKLLSLGWYLHAQSTNFAYFRHLKVKVTIGLCKKTGYPCAYDNID